MDSEIREHVSGNEWKVKSPPAKRLKQVRLPFKILDHKITQVAEEKNDSLVPCSHNPKKKRYSGNEGHPRSSKSQRVDAESENKPFIQKHVEGNKFVKKTNDKSPCVITDSEISSSCEHDVQYIGEVNALSSKCKPKSVNILEKFIKKEHAQVPEVSTSTVDGDNSPVADESGDKNASSLNKLRNCDLQNSDADNLNDVDAKSNDNLLSSGDIVDSFVEGDVTDKAKNDSLLNISAASDTFTEKINSEADLTATSIDFDSSVTEDASLLESCENSDDKETETTDQNKKIKKQIERARIKSAKLEKLAKAKEAKLKEKELIREQKEKERAEIKAKKEEEKRILEESKLEEKRKKEEEKVRKEEEKKKKDEEKVRKELEKKKKDDEKRKKDEEKRMLEDEMLKKEKKVKEAFVNFFIKKEQTAASEENVNVSQFKPFQITKRMEVAPISRSVIKDVSSFERQMDNQSSPTLYLSEIKSGRHIPLCGERTYPPPSLQNYEKLEDDDDDEEENEDVSVIMDDQVDPVIENDGEKKNVHRAKLLLFHENRRPPYWGTYRKNSRVIRPRCPFTMDKNLFDYEVDSDDEWEEEEPGESLHGSDDDKESEDDYEEDGEFMVPHGYLSADEEMEDPDEENSPENQKEKLKLRAAQFQKDMKRKTQHVKKPRIVGCVWMSTLDVAKEIEFNERVKFLEAYKAVALMKLPVPSTHSVTGNTTMDTSPANNSFGFASDDGTTTPRSSSFKKPVPEEAMPFLIRLLHANPNCRPNLVVEFQEFWEQHWNKLQSDVDRCEGIVVVGTSEISKRQLEKTIQQIASWIKYPNPEIYTRFCWVVNDDVLKRYELTDLPIPNCWQYVSKNPSLKTTLNEVSPASSKISKFVVSMPSSPIVNTITKYTKPVTFSENKLCSTPMTDARKNPSSSIADIRKSDTEDRRSTTGASSKRVTLKSFLISKSPSVSDENAKPQKDKAIDGVSNRPEVTESKSDGAVVVYEIN